MMMSEDEGAMTLILTLGKAYHEAGTPTDVLEDLLRRVARALGVELQVNALPTSLTVAVGPGTHQRLVILRLPPGRLHLSRLVALNEVFEAIVDLPDEIASALAAISEIDSQPVPRSPLFTILPYALLSCGAAVILGGGVREIQASTFIGLSVGTIAAIAERNSSIEQLFEVLAAFVATVAVASYEKFVGPIALYIAIIAGIVQLLPGFALTTALHELASKHLVAGTARLGSVLVTLLSLGCGFALAIAFIGASMLPSPTTISVGSTGLLVFPAAAAMGIGIAVILRARFVDYGWVTLTCVAAISISRLFNDLPGHQVAAFSSALIIGVATKRAAGTLRVPQEVMLIPGIIVLVPGALSYAGILAVYRIDLTNAVNLSASAFLTSIFIVAGILLSQLTLRPADSSNLYHH